MPDNNNKKRIYNTRPTTLLFEGTCLILLAGFVLFLIWLLP